MTEERHDGHVAIRIGPGFALVSAPTFALVDTTNAALAETLWMTIEDGGGIDDLLELLSATGLKSLGDFALAQREGDAVRLVLRGAASAVVSSGGAERSVDAGDVRTWVEEVVTECAGFTLALGAALDVPLPFRVASAIVPADAIMWPAAQGRPALDGSDMSWIDEFVPPAMPVVARPPAEQVAPVPDPPAPVAPAAPAPAPEPEPEPAVEPAAVAPQPAADASTSEHTAMPPREDAGTLTLPASAVASGAADEYDYDALYGHTVARSVSGAAVDAPADDGAVPGMIQSVPSAGGVADAGARQGDHDGMTISVAQLRAMRAPTGDSAAAPPPLGGPSVQALVCASGHVNPPTTTVCRVCSGVLNPSPVTVARPKLGRLVFSSGQVVPLDRPALIGRNPKVEGQMPNELPQIVKIDIGQALSRSHVAVRLEGWQVLVEDLGSANGTIVTLPGAPARRLRAGEPVLLEHQAHIDLGGEVTATYDAWG